MMKAAKRQIPTFSLIVLGFISLAPAAGAEGRTAEFRFQLSSDPGSEFSARLPAVTVGSLKIEAEWSPINTPGANAQASRTRLTLVLFRPEGTEVARTSGTSPLRLEMQVSEQDVVRSFGRERPTDFSTNLSAGFSTWTVKIINAAVDNRDEVSGVLRAAVPITSGLLADKEFVLLGSGNAREIPFLVLGRGRLSIDTNWQSDSPAGNATSTPLLTVLLLNPGEGKTYARKQGRSPLIIEQQIIDPARDGARFVVRVQNDTSSRVKGRLRVRFAPTP